MNHIHLIMVHTEHLRAALSEMFDRMQFFILCVFPIVIRTHQELLRISRGPGTTFH